MKKMNLSIIKSVLFSLFERKLLILSSVLGFLFSVLYIMGINIAATNSTCILEGSTWLKILCAFPLFYLGSAVVIKFFPAIANTDKFFKYNHCLSLKAVFFIVWAVIFVLWIPTLLAGFPGIYGYDSIYQIKLYMEGIYNLAHPFVHSWLLGFCVVDIGKNLLGSAETGMLIYAVFQMLCLSAAFSALYTYLVKRNTPVLIRILILLFFTLVPTNAIMAISSTKDVLYAAFFALMTMFSLMAIDDPTRFRSKGFCALFALVTFMMIVFRSQGFYVFIFGILIFLSFFKKYYRSILIITVAVVVSYTAYSKVIPLLVNGYNNITVREMMSVPVMQLSRAGLDNKDELTKQQAQMITEYIPNYHLYYNEPGISDAFKKTLDTKRITENPKEFFGLWLKVGLKCPITYIDAWARLTIGLWYPDMDYPDEGAYHPYWEYYSTGKIYSFDENKYLLLDQTPVPGFEKLNDFYYELAYEDSIQNLPGITLLFSAAVPLWVMLLYIAMCIYYKQYKKLPLIGFGFGLLLTLFLGPVVLYRYVYPLIVSVPLFLSQMSIMARKE
jgi:hypothetical protein